MRLPILVSTLIAKERDVAIVVEPHDPGAQIAVARRGEWTCLREIVDFPDPQVQHPVYRRHEGNPSSVRADPDRRPVGAREEELARYQGRPVGGGLRFANRAMAQKHSGARRSREQELATGEILAIHRRGLPWARVAVNGSPFPPIPPRTAWPNVINRGPLSSLLRHP